MVLTGPVLLQLIMYIVQSTNKKKAKMVTSREAQKLPYNKLSLHVMSHSWYFLGVNLVLSMRPPLLSFSVLDRVIEEIDLPPTYSECVILSQSSLSICGCQHSRISCTILYFNPIIDKNVILYASKIYLYAYILTLLQNIHMNVTV